jgi:TonB-dependent receptor
MRKHYAIDASYEAAKLKSGLLRAGVSAVALCLFGAGSAWAQTEGASAQTTPAAAQDSEATAQTEEEIVVQGYRQSLQSAQQIKKNSDVIVDSVTAEDIGALPDRSVTETLQRIPGVAINRFAAGVDPDHFSVEGSGVVVRGLTYVRSEFNGREAFSANNGRALSFADVPSELMGGVDVFKSPSADRIEGGIAGVVNLRTRTPFDAKGFVLAASAEVNYGDFQKDPGANLNAIISNRWDTGIGEIGFLASASYSNLKSRADRLQVSSFRIRNLYSDGDVVQNPGATQVGRVLFPRGAVLGSQEFDRTRYGYSAAAQWRSNDGSMEAVFQFLRSDARQAWAEHTVEIATDNVTNNGDSRRVPGTTLEFDEDGLFASGTITGPTGWRADQTTPGDARVPMLGLQSNNIARYHTEKLVTDDYGFNFKWDVNDRLGVSLDYQHVASSSYIADHTLWNSTYQNASIQLRGSDYPIVQFLPPQVCSGPAANSQDPPGTDNDCAGFGGRPAAAPGSQYSPAYFGAGHTSFTDPFNSFPRAAMDHIEDSDGNSDAARLDLEYSFPESSFLKSIKAGVRYADRDQTARFSTYNWGVITEQWGSGGPVWLDDPVDGVPGGTGGTPIGIGANVPYYFDNFFQGQAPNPLAGQGRLFYGSNIIKNYDQYAAYATAVNREWRAPTTSCGDGVVRNDGWNPLALRCGVIPGTPFLPGEINPIRETNKAAYVMTRFDSEFGSGLRLSGNVGVRYTKTDRTAGGFMAFPQPGSPFPSETDCANVPVGQNPPPFCTFPVTTRNAARGFLNGALVPNDVKTSYEYWLPSANVKLEVGGGLQFRAAYFKGVAPPATGLTRNYFNVNLAPVQNVDANGNAIPNSFTLQGTINAGNPYLKPTTGDNFDLTAEWYFSSVGQLTVSAFYKRLHNVLTNSTVRMDFTNNGATFPAVVTTPVNASETGTIKGVEVAYQQTFDFLPGVLKGFGLQANYTYIESSGVPQSTLSETDPDVGAGRVTTVDLASLPLQGLSKHNVNITPFFDAGPLSLRATYSWRSDFLLTIRDVIVPNDPIINKATGQLDASIFYALSDNVKIGLQGSNLLNEVVKTKAVVTGLDGENVEVPRGWYMNDRRISGIMRFSF